MLPTGFWIFLFVLFFAVIIWDAFLSDSGILRVWQLEKDYLIMKEQNSSMAVEIEKLQAELELLESRPELLEEVAREKLQMARPGEEIYLFPTEPENK
jgi:cell division protein DivIC